MEHINKLITAYPALSNCKDDITKAYTQMRETLASGNRIYVCGNGGSAADCQHITGELMKGFLLKRPVSLPEDITKKMSPETTALLSSKLQSALPCHSLTTETSLITALCNDISADIIFAQQIYGYGRKGDCLVCISTSGNAANVCLAAELGAAMGLCTVALTGQGGGKLSLLCDTTVKAPADKTPQIQEYHLPIYHALCADLEAFFFES
ncbi:MAG: SIS domain-containing protein [Defluviitaleaceae bacterium]|nr:SIS domain-containing protein [Defluviitaleaceae bacterium]